MDHSPMEFVMHHPDHHGGNASSSVDRGTRSACPALRAAAEHNQHPMFSASRPFQLEHLHGNTQSFWEPPAPPLPHSRWMSDPFQPPTALPPHTGQISQPPYPAMNGPINYNSRYRTPMLSLQRIGGTAPIQHSQGGFSNPSQSQPQATGGSGTGSGAQSSRANSTLPPLNPMPPQASAFMQTGRPAQQTSRQSPPPFVRQSSMPSTSLSMAEVTVSSSGRMDEAGDPHSASSSPPRRPAASGHGEGHGAASEPRRNSRTSRGLPRMSSVSDWSSDDDSDPDAVAIPFLEAAASGAPVAEDRLRAHQIIRGAASGKRVASRKAITSLESVNILTLPENERTCVICYNDFGVETPEGVSESPLRLPKCKHVFGDHCIKKWFEESDSCPYCRDKVPSEPQYRHVMNPQALQRFLRQANQMQMQHQLQMRQARERERGDPDSLNRPPNTMFSGITALTSSPFAELDYGLGDPAIGRRADGGSAYSSRPPIWYGNLGERHSPLPFGPGEATEIRRRSRARHGSLRGFAPGRPHFAASPASNVPQSQPYAWLNRPNANHSHNHRHSASSSNTSGRPAFDANVPPFPFQPQMGAPSEPYLNPLNISSPAGTTEDYPTLPHMRSHYPPPLSPTFGGPDVYMTNSDDSVLGGTTSHQQL